MNELGNCLILRGLGSGWDLGCYNGMPWEWEDHVVKVRRLVGINNSWTWSGWRKLEWSMFSALDSTMRRGGKNKCDGSPSFSPHIVCCLQSLAQRNLNKGVKGGRFGHFLLQLPLSLQNDFSPPTFNMCSYKTCKSFHEKRLNTFLQGNLQGGGVVFCIVKVLTTLKKMGTRPIFEQVLPKIVLLALKSH